MAMMRVLCSKGHDVLTRWDPADQASVDAAVKQLEKQFAQGRVAFAGEAGNERQLKKPEDLRDAPEQDVLLVPQYQGG
jgi:hypothetical protein